LGVLSRRAFLLGAFGGLVIGAGLTLVLVDRVLRFDSPEAVIAIAALVATTITSALGLYFTSRARTAPYRDLLYQKQTVLVTDMLETIALVDVFCGIALTTVADESTRQKAWTELQEQLSRLALLGARAAALLPNEVYLALGNYHHVAVRILVDSGAGSADHALLAEVRARSAHVVACARALLGVEALSKETLALFSGDSLERVAQTDLNHYLAVVRQAEEAERGRSQ